MRPRLFLKPGRSWTSIGVEHGVHAVGPPVGRGVGGGHLDHRPFAGPLRPDVGGERAERGVQPHGVHADGHRLQLALLVGREVVGVDRREAAEGVEGRAVGAQLVVRPPGAEAGDRAEHEPRVLGPQHVVAEPEALEDAGPHALDHDVGRLDEAGEELGALGGLEVDADAALAPVPAQVEQAEAVRAADGRRAAAADGIAVDPFHLDDVGAHVGQVATQARRPELGDLDDADAVQEVVAGQRLAPQPASPARSLASWRWRCWHGISLRP